MTGSEQAMTPPDLHAELLTAFKRYSSLTALTIDRVVYSYERLFTEALKLAAHIKATASDGAIGILAQRSLQSYAAVLAALLLGRPYVALNMKFPRERQLHMARSSKCAIFIADDRSEERRRELNQAFGFDHPADAPPHAGSADLDDAELGAPDDRPAYFMFTSGTTGLPKGVVVTRGNLLAYLQGIRLAVPLPVGARCTQLFDLSFDLSVHDLFHTWCSGGSLCVMNERDSADPIGFAKREAITCWFSVPSVVTIAKRMGTLAPGALPELGLTLFCGEPLAASVVKAWLQVAPNTRVFNLYGPTEATIAITTQECTSPEYLAHAPSVIPLGKPLAGSEVVVVAADGVPAPMGAGGELWLGGPQVADGYIDAVEATSAKFVMRDFPGRRARRWYRTGDIVERSADHGLLFRGRVDDQVKIRGYRIELFEIEEALRQAAGTLDVAVTPWPISETGAAEGLVGFICGGKADAKQVMIDARKLLPDYMAPGRVIEVASLPLNANGKVDRARLRETYLSAAAATARDHDAPKTPAANSRAALDELVQAWSELFPRQQVSPGSSFATLGGDSLSFINVLLETERLLGRVPDNWTSLTLSDLASHGSRKAGRSWMADLDMASLIRCLAIIMVVASHLEVSSYANGETSGLMLISGLFFGKFQLKSASHKAAFRADLKYIERLAVSYFVLFLLFLPVTIRGKFGAARFVMDTLMLQDIVPYHGVLEGLSRSYLWFIHALIHIVFLIALIGVLSRYAINRGWSKLSAATIILITSASIGFVGRFVVPAMSDPTFFSQRLDDESIFRYYFLGQMFTFATGAMIGFWRGRMMYIGVAIAVIDAALSWGPYDPAESIFLIASAISLAVLPTVRAPRLVALPIYAVADASLAIYMVHMPLKAVLLKFEVPMMAIFAASFVTGVAVWKVMVNLLNRYAAASPYRRIANAFGKAA
jgi:D-alanine--poly(phosphoribitol) ligase subunit 1